MEPAFPPGQCPVLVSLVARGACFGHVSLLVQSPALPALCPLHSRSSCLGGEVGTAVGLLLLGVCRAQLGAGSGPCSPTRALHPWSCPVWSSWRSG